MVRHDSNSDPPARPSKRPPQGVCGLRHAFRGVRVPVCYRQGALLHSAPSARAMLDGARSYLAFETGRSPTSTTRERGAQLDGGRATYPEAEDPDIRLRRRRYGQTSRTAGLRRNEPRERPPLIIRQTRRNGGPGSREKGAGVEADAARLPPCCFGVETPPVTPTRRRTFLPALLRWLGRATFPAFLFFVPGNTRHACLNLGPCRTAGPCTGR